MTLGPSVRKFKATEPWARRLEHVHVCERTLTHTHTPLYFVLSPQKLMCKGTHFFPGHEKALLVRAVGFLPEIYKHNWQAPTAAACPPVTSAALRS